MCCCFFFVFFFVFFLLFDHEAYGILAPQLGMESAPPALEGKVFSTTEPTGKSPYFLIDYFHLIS